MGKSKLEEIFSLIRYGPIDSRNVFVIYYDRVEDDTVQISFDEFLILQTEFKIPNHRIRAIIEEKNKQYKILFRKEGYKIEL